MRLGLAIDLDTCVGCHACAVACKEWNGASLMGGAPDYDAHGKAPSGVWYNRIRHYEIEGDPAFSPRGCGASDLTTNLTSSITREPGCEHPGYGAQRSQTTSRSERPAGEAKLSAARQTVVNLRPGAARDFNEASRSRSSDVPLSKTVNVPMSCMHCEEAHCVTVCPTGASYKRAEDGIVLVDPNRCMGCNYCAWACPYGARELDEDAGVMKKCTLCVDRIYDTQLPEEERQPACVLACPTHARHFGDYDDPRSKVSQLAAQRGRQSMLDDLGYKPTNAYLSPRKPAQVQPTLPLKSGLSEKAKAFVNRLIQL
jgi:sulfite dehydrogenase (quinone) subunit SoeB